MSAKTNARQLVTRFKDHVNPYMGSGMLSNTPDDSAILWQSKKCALICAEEILKVIEAPGDYWFKTKQLQQLVRQIEKLK